MKIILKAIFLSSQAQVQRQKSHPTKNGNVQARPITLIMILICIHFGISVNTILSNMTQMNNVKAIIIIVFAKIIIGCTARQYGFVPWYSVAGFMQIILRWINKIVVLQMFNTLYIFWVTNSGIKFHFLFIFKFILFYKYS